MAGLSLTRAGMNAGQFGVTEGALRYRLKKLEEGPGRKTEGRVSLRRWTATRRGSRRSS